jgi:16S rRNA C967 or C1407 C5-methylase (RsmB/RsmF family)
LIYATCSSEPEENEHVVERLLAEGAPFVPERPAGAPPELLDDRGQLRTVPHRDALDGFFAAVLRRRGAGA